MEDRETWFKQCNCYAHSCIMVERLLVMVNYENLYKGVWFTEDKFLHFHYIFAQKQFQWDWGPKLNWPED